MTDDSRVASDPALAFARITNLRGQAEAAYRAARLANTQLETSEAANGDSARLLVAARAEVAALEDELQHTRGDVQEANRIAAVVQIALEESNLELRAMKANVDGYKAKLAEKIAELDTLRTDHRRTIRKSTHDGFLGTEAGREEIDSLKAQLKGAHADSRSYKERLDASEQAVLAAHQEIERLKTEHGGNIAAIAFDDMERSFNASKRSVVDLTARVTALHAALETKTSELEDAKRRLTEATSTSLSRRGRSPRPKSPACSRSQSPRPRLPKTEGVDPRVAAQIAELKAMVEAATAQRALATIAPLATPTTSHGPVSLSSIQGPTLNARSGPSSVPLSSMSNGVPDDDTQSEYGSLAGSSMGGKLQDEVNSLLRPLEMSEAEIHKSFGGTKGVFNSNELVSLLKSSFDPNGTRWRSRSIFSEETVRKFAKAKNSSPNRDVWRQEKIIVEYKVPEGISDSRAEKQAEAWDELRPGWIQTLRRLVSANGDYEECLRALNLALRSKRLSRLASFVETNIRDAGILLNPPLAADLLIYTIDSSYSTANYGTTNNSADWHACTSRIGDEDESFLSRRVVKAYMKRITKSGHTEVSIFGDEFHREELNKRIGDVLSNDPFDPDRGCEAYEKYTNKMDVLNRQLESGQISAERVSGVIVCEEITKPMQQWSLKRERQNLRRGSRKLPTIQGGGPAATAAVASMHFDSCPPQTPPIYPSLMAASATLPPQIALPMPPPVFSWSE